MPKNPHKTTLTDKQQRFVEEYCVDFNLTKAALRAGYSPDSAYNTGWENMRKHEIKAAIDTRLKDLALSSEETLKSISDIAKASLNDYFIVKEVVRTPKVMKHLTEVIADMEAEIEDADKFIERAQIQDHEALEKHTLEQKRRRMEIIRLQIELERNPNASRVESGPAEFVKVAELDLAKLVQDKEAGRIKSVSPTEFGTKVEMYAADAALRDLARIHGLFEKDNSQVKPDLSGFVINVKRNRDDS